jgi:hypothetical protein
MCGKIGLITSPGCKATNLSGSSASNPVVYADVSDDLTQWDQAGDFKAMIELSADDNIPGFPLCDHCLDAATAHATRLTELVLPFSQQTSRALEVQPSTEVIVISPFLIPSDSPKDPAPKARHYVLPIKDLIRSSDADRPPIQPVFTPQFAQLAAFRLTIIGPFAAINTLRLGTLPCMPVPTQEIQNGLWMLCRLLMSEMKTVGLECLNIHFGAVVSFSTPGAIYELRIPKKSKDCEKFNLALNQMMASFNLVFNSDYMKRMRPSNLIDTAKQTIAGESYAYSIKEPANFTRGMRKLAVNLKTIQAYQTIFRS